MDAAQPDEPVKCSSCHALPPQLKCYCMETPASLCSKCAVGHLSAGGELPHRPFPVERNPSGQESCEVCNISPAQFICTCMFPWISYCSDCASIHVSSDSGHTKHSLEPIYAKFYLQSSTDLTSYYERQHFADELRAEVLRNPAAIDDCIAEINKVAFDLISTIEGWRTNTVQHLQRVRATVQESVQICCAQIDAMRYELHISPRMRIDQLIQLAKRDILEDAKDEMVMVKYSVDGEKMARQLQFVFSFTENYLMLEAVDKVAFAIPKTNMVVEYALPDVTPHEVTLHTDVKFKSFAAWCALPSGHLFVTGGQTQKDGIQYHRETILVDTSSKSVRPAPAMRHPRCKHGILYHKQHVYVFGGYCDEYLKNCERFSVKEQAWAPLPDMRDARDCVSAAEWKDRIYIVGYASNRIEVLNLGDMTMTVLPVQLRLSLMNLLVPKHCAVTHIDNCEMCVLLDNEAIRINLEAMTVRTLKLSSKGEKTWYSPCPPVVIRGESAFFFTMEMELWKVDIKTGEVKFVHKSK